MWNPDTLVTMHFQPADRKDTIGYSPLATVDVLRSAGALEPLGHAATRSVPLATRADADPVVAQVEFVSSQYLAALATRPRIGRLLSDREADGAASSLLSSRLHGVSPLDPTSLATSSLLLLEQRYSRLPPPPHGRRG